MNKRWIAAFGLTVALVCLLVGVAAAGRSANFAINWQVLSSGGAPASAAGGTVKLNGSVGQVAVGSSASASYSARSGYWLQKGGAAPPRIKVFLPAVWSVSTQ
jgi:hypothetical protein